MKLVLKLVQLSAKIKADMSDRYDQKYLDCQLFDPVLEIEQVVTFIRWSSI